MDGTFYLLDFNNERGYITLPVSLKDIILGEITVVTGDEHMEIVTTNGDVFNTTYGVETKTESFIDGRYKVIENGKWIVGKEWFNRVDSFQWLVKDF